MPREIPYPTPGEILLEEFLKPMGITQYRLAKEIGVPQRCIGSPTSCRSCAKLHVPTSRSSGPARFSGPLNLTFVAK
jgi:hypothetical protein